MNTSNSPIPVISSVLPLVAQYDVWLCDVWGVLHNGEVPFADAGDACIRFREQGGTVILVSNSPRPGDAVAKQMAGIGVADGVFDAVVTSGDTTRQVLQDRSNQSLFHLGPERDAPLLDGLDITLSDIDQCGYVLCSGLYDDLTETPDDYSDLLARMRAHELPMLCANPDIQVERGDRLIYCAGALAAAYSAIGGEVIYTGKPHAPIYERARHLIQKVRTQDVPQERILCIGDGIKTDMAGAAVSGMDALYIASLLHIDGGHDGASLTPEILETAFQGAKMRPIAAQSGLKW